MILLAYYFPRINILHISLYGIHQTNGVLVTQTKCHRFVQTRALPGGDSYRFFIQHLMWGPLTYVEISQPNVTDRVSFILMFLIEHLIGVYKTYNLDKNANDLPYNFVHK